MLKLTAPLTSLTGGDPVVSDITEGLPSVSTSTDPVYSEPIDLAPGTYAFEVRVTSTGTSSTSHFFTIRLTDPADNEVMGYHLPAHESWPPTQAVVFHTTITAPGAYRISMQTSTTSASYAVGHIDRIRVILVSLMGPLLVGVADGWAFEALRTWAVSIGKTHETITEIHIPVKVVGPSLHGLFAGCQALTTVPEFDTRQVTSMHSMFYDCASLTSVPAFDTRNVTIMQSMFYGCPSLTSVPAFDTSEVTSMRSMFYNCSALTSVPEFDTIEVTDASFMFYGCSSLTSVPYLDTSKVANTIAMFYGCSSLTSIPHIDTSQVEIMTHMFVDCTSLTSVPELNTSQVTSMTAMFHKCSSLTSIPHMDTSQVESMGLMFDGCSSLTSVPDLDYSKVTDVEDMFYKCSSLESVTLTGMGDAFTTGSSEAYRTLGMKDTKLNATAANALMESLGTPPPGGFLKLPSTAAGSDTSIATSKNWQVTVG